MTEKVFVLVIVLDFVWTLHVQFCLVFKNRMYFLQKNFFFFVINIIEYKKKSLRLFADTLKLVSVIFYQIFIFSPNDSPLKTMKNVFYFIQKALSILEIFKFLYFFPFPHFPYSKGQMEVK